VAVLFVTVDAAELLQMIEGCDSRIGPTSPDRTA
jgi:hypothetical protein